MKILLINDFLISGGVEIVLKNLSNYLSSKHEVSVLVFEKSYDYPKNDFNNVSVCFLNKKYFIKKKSKSPMRYIKYRFFYYSKIINMLKKINPDIVIAFKIDNIRLINRLLEYKIFDFKTIGYFHESYLLDENNKDILHKEYGNIDLFVTINEQSRFFYEKYTNKPTYLIYNFINLREIKKKKENIILLVSRIDRDKRVDVFIRAVKICQDVLPDYRFVIIGNSYISGPSFLDNIKVSASGLKVEFLGHLEHDKVCDYYAKSKVLVLSSEMESWGLTLQESMFYNCARVSTKFIGDSLGVLIEDGVDGLVCELNEVDMAEKIIKICKDEKLYNSIVLNAKNKFLSLSNDFFEKWDNIILEIYNAK